MAIRTRDAPTDVTPAAPAVPRHPPGICSRRAAARVWRLCFHAALSVLFSASCLCCRGPLSCSPFSSWRPVLCAVHSECSPPFRMASLTFLIRARTEPADRCTPSSCTHLTPCQTPGPIINHVPFWAAHSSFGNQSCILSTLAAPPGPGTATCQSLAAMPPLRIYRPLVSTLHIDTRPWPRSGARLC